MKTIAYRTPHHKNHDTEANWIVAAIIAIAMIAASYSLYAWYAQNHQDLEYDDYSTTIVDRTAPAPEPIIALPKNEE